MQTCVTSPPYFGLRDYGVQGQIGLESTPDEFIRSVVYIFREVHRVLRDDGTLWLNLGDSYSGSGKGAYADGIVRLSDRSKKQTTSNGTHQGMFKKAETGLKPKDLIGIPWRVALALQADGWYLRQDIIWHKPNPMPESVTDRCTKAHEYIFLLSKSERYFFDHKAIQEPSVTNDIRRPYGSQGGWQLDGRPINQRPNGRPRKGFDKKQGGGGTSFDGHSGSYKADGSPIGVPGMRNKRSVWTVTTKPYKVAHFATFPPDLVKPCILAGAPRDSLVLDPFLGSGTTAAVAKELKRSYVGIELNPAYVELALQRLGQLKSANQQGDEGLSLAG